MRCSGTLLIACSSPSIFYRSTGTASTLPTGLHAPPSHGLLKPTGKLSRRIVAVADLHGDLEHAYNVLRMAGIVDGQGRWIAGHDVLASTGDIVDRGGEWEM